MRLPSAPILKVLERAAIRQGYTGDQSVGDTPAEGLTAFCEILGVHPKSIERVRKQGWVHHEFADRLAVALGLHPIIVWPAEYGVWLHQEWTERDSEERELRRDEASRRRVIKRAYWAEASRRSAQRRKEHAA